MKKTILITGAAGGIGQALAFHFARLGYELFLTSQNSDSLDQLGVELKNRFPQVRFHLLALDLTEKEAPARLFHFASGTETCVLNAGLGVAGEFVSQDLNLYRGLMRLNCDVIVELCWMFGRSMKERRSGNLVVVSSFNAFLPSPYMSVYSGSKAFVTTFLEGLHAELRLYGVNVFSVCPGGVQTQFHLRSGLTNEIVEKFASTLISPELVAREIETALKSRKAVVIPGRANRIFYFLLRFLPRLPLIRFLGNTYRGFLPSALEGLDSSDKNQGDQATCDGQPTHGRII